MSAQVEETLPARSFNWMTVTAEEIEILEPMRETYLEENLPFVTIRGNQPADTLLDLEL